jgi:hypothetical protein
MGRHRDDDDHAAPDGPARDGPRSRRDRRIVWTDDGKGDVSRSRPQDHGETPTIEVRVFRDGQLVERELCESEDQAALAVEAWAEVEGVEFEVDDLSIRHRPGDVLEPEPPEPGADEYPRAVETESSVDRRT